MTPQIAYTAGWVALAYAILQTLVDVMRTRRALQHAIQTGGTVRAVAAPADAANTSAPDTPIDAAAVAPEAPETMPRAPEPSHPYVPSMVETLLQAWSPFYTFCVAVALFGIGFYMSSLIPVVQKAKVDNIVFAASPSPTPSPTPTPTPTPAPTPSPTPAATNTPTATPTPLATPAATRRPAQALAQNARPSLRPSVQGPARPAGTYRNVPQVGNAAPPRPRVGNAAPPPPQPSASALPTPTPDQVTCTGTLTAPLWFTPDGPASVAFVLACPQPVVPPVAVVGVGLQVNDPQNDVALYSAAPNGDNSYEWRWVVNVPKPPGTPEPSLDGGRLSVVYVKLCPTQKPDTVPDACMPKSRTATRLRAPLLAVTMKERTTFTNMTSWIQGLSGLFAAFVALIGGIVKVLRRPTTMPSMITGKMN